MKIQKRLVVGILLLVLTFAFAVPTQVMAYTAQQINADRAGGKYRFTSNEGTVVTMSVGGDTLRFRLLTTAPPQTNPAAASAFANNYIYQLQDQTDDECRTGLAGSAVAAQIPAQISVPKANIDNDPGNLVNARLTFFRKVDGVCRMSPDIQSAININNSFGAELSVSTAAGGSGGDEDEGLACDTQLTNPLSWILCPVIELGSTFTDFVFSDIVKPLLSEVPISTNPQDPGYKAWNQFRIIGNIVLVGTMLAVVYAQVRGDK